MAQALDPLLSLMEKSGKILELGHLLLRNGQIAEHHGSAAVKRLEKLSWKQWAQRLNTVLKFYDFSFSPDELFLWRD